MRRVEEKPGCMVVLEEMGQWSGNRSRVSVSPQVVIALSGGEIVYFEMDQVGVSAVVPCAVVKLHGCVRVCTCAAHAKTGSESKLVSDSGHWLQLCPCPCMWH